MKYRPILFSAPMVRALLAGTKTQTRRIVKPQPDTCLDGEPYWYVGGYRFRAWQHKNADDVLRKAGDVIRCPYGEPGDHLYVREAIKLVPDQDPDDGTGRVLSVYAADGSLTLADAWPWKRNHLVAMHCPRGLSRIELEVTAVRVERLQDISEADAEAEGPPKNFTSWRDNFCALWQQINGDGSWAANPWVWVVEFRRIER